MAARARRLSASTAAPCSRACALAASPRAAGCGETRPRVLRPEAPAGPLRRPAWPVRRPAPARPATRRPRWSCSTAATGSPATASTSWTRSPSVITGLGWATWNVEYRQTGDGGAWPTRSPTSPRPSTGSSAGRPRPGTTSSSSGTPPAASSRPGPPRAPRGPPAARPRSDRSGRSRSPGVLDLTRAAPTAARSPPVIAFLGGTPDRGARPLRRRRPEPAGARRVPGLGGARRRRPGGPTRAGQSYVAATELPAGGAERSTCRATTSP